MRRYTRFNFFFFRLGSLIYSCLDHYYVFIFISARNLGGNALDDCISRRFLMRLPGGWFFKRLLVLSVLVFIFSFSVSFVTRSINRETKRKKKINKNNTRKKKEKSTYVPKCTRVKCILHNKSDSSCWPGTHEMYSHIIATRQRSRLMGSVCTASLRPWFSRRPELKPRPFITTPYRL